jgi:5-formyltetrahydrofolate cyclo-ligase
LTDDPTYLLWVKSRGTHGTGGVSLYLLGFLIAPVQTIKSMVSDKGSRANLRAQIRAQRRALSERQREDYALQFASHFSKSRLFQNSQRIAFYMANDGELDPSELMAIAWSMGKECFLPVLTAPHDKSLLFAKYDPDEPLVYNQFGIPEPFVAARHRIKARTLDLIIMPLVAFDEQGNRIGMGGGYYDRTLAFLKARTQWHKPRLAGIGYGFQQVASIDNESWDVPLTYIATEKKLLKII